MKLFNRSFSIVFLTIAVFFGLFQQWTHAEIIPFDSPRWEMGPAGARVEDYLGQKSLKLTAGIVYLKDVQFTNGIIEFDIALSRGRGFLGVVFRMQDGENYEEFYLRPHQSENPDAMQYTPVFNGMSAWQLYHGMGFNAAVKFQFDQWIHVKLIISGGSAELYLGNIEQPVMYMPELKREIKPGLVGVEAVPISDGHFANFSITEMDNPPMKNKAKGPEEIKAGTVMTWAVSGAFGESALANKFLLSAADKESLTWKKLECETSGLANVSKVLKLESGKNTVFARVSIDSDSRQIKKLKFGFSDRVKVYLNDRLLYGGNNMYRSRDPRFLGSIGYFDELYLPLEKGKNELWMAISENFGGWGLMGLFEDMAGITVSSGL